MGDRRRWASTYLATQATTVVVWWTALATSPRVRGWFEMDAGRRDLLTAFAAGDAVVLALGSALAAVGLARGRRWAAAVAGAVTGGCLYATLLLAAWVGLGGDGAVGLVPMVAATAASAAATLVAMSTGDGRGT